MPDLNYSMSIWAMHFNFGKMLILYRQCIMKNAYTLKFQTVNIFVHIFNAPLLSWIIYYFIRQEQNTCTLTIFKFLENHWNKANCTLAISNTITCIKILLSYNNCNYLVLIYMYMYINFTYIYIQCICKL